MGYEDKGFHESVDLHHFTPVSKGGKEKTPIHKVCHNKIHSLFNVHELKMNYNSPELLLQHEEMQKFIKWVSKKEPLFFTQNKQKKW